MEIVCYACGRGENPENTLEGIVHCQSVNPEWRIEMDIQLTKDGELILFHDDNAERTTGIDAIIGNLSYTKTQELNPGANFSIYGDYIYTNNPIKIPRLEEVFSNFKNIKLLLDVHTSNTSVVDKIIYLVEKYKAESQIVIVSKYDKIVQLFRKHRPDWVYGVPANEARKMIYSSFIFLDDLFPIKSDVLMLPQSYGKINVLTSRVINHAKKRNKKLWAWIYEGDYVKSVDSIKELEEVEALGIDGVFTDFPEKLKGELADKSAIH